MRHTYHNSVRRGNAAIYVAPSKFDKPEPKPDRSLSNSEILALTRGRRILEVVPRYARGGA